jgi:uncharacterized protein
MCSKYFVAAALLLLSAAPLQAQSVTAGIEAWQRADYTQAVAIWTPLAANGDADAEFNLGQAYRLGRGVPTNLAAAETWFERAANRGHVDAQTTLGLLLFQNGDQARGLKWLSKAADQGEARAMLVYGTALFNGDGVPQDPARGYAYVSRAAAQGLTPAKQTLEQLDQLLPAADRKRGLALAHELGKAAGGTTPSTRIPMKTEQSAAADLASKPAPKPKLKEVAQAAPTSPPKPAPASDAKPAPASGGWRIQLGAFSQKSNAEALFRKLASNNALVGRQPHYLAAGAVTRLQVGPFESKGAAAAACKAVGIACFPVPAK